MLTLPSLTACLAALAPTCGPTRLLAVDGYAGSGKTTFAARLAEALGGGAGGGPGGGPGGAAGAPVVHLDDLATHEEFFAWTGRLRTEVLAPLTEGRPVRHRVYDWERARFDAVRELPAAPPFLILEGVGAGRRAVRPYLAALLWMDLDAETARNRGELRDGPSLADFWQRWTAEQAEHFRVDPSRPFADFLVTGQAGRPIAHAA
jgi:uridine kinase